MSLVNKCPECDQYEHKGHHEFCSFLETPMLHLNRLPPARARITFIATLTIGESQFDLRSIAEQLGWAMPNDNTMTFSSEATDQLAAEMRAMKQVLADASVALLRAQIHETLFDTKYGDEM